MEKIPPTPADLPAPVPYTDHIMRGILYALGGYFLFTAMQASAKILSETHSVIEIAFYRNFLGMIPLIIYMRLKNEKILVWPGNARFVFLRVVLGSTGVILTFAAMKYLPMSDATVIFFTGILLTPMLAFFLLKEYIGPHRWAAIILGMAGVILMLHPSGEGQMLGFILAFAAAFTQASTAVILRHLRNESAFTVTFYFLLCGMLIPGIFMPFVAHMPDLSSWGLLIFVGLAGVIGQYLITRAFASAPASVIVTFGYSGLIWASVFDIVLWGYVPGWSIYAGGLIIILSNLYIGHRERLAEKRRLESL